MYGVNNAVREFRGQYTVFWSGLLGFRHGEDDAVVRVAPLLARVGDWATFIEGGLDEAMAGRLELHLQTGRPLGSDVWMEALEAGLGRRVRSRGPGRPRKDHPKGRK